MDRMDQQPMRRSAQQENRDEAEEARRVRRSVSAESLYRIGGLLKDMETFIGESHRMPLRRDLCLIDEGMMLDMLSQLRVALPDAVKEAADVMEKSTQILEEARQEADSLNRQTEENAASVKEKAKQDAEAAREEADVYVKKTRQDAKMEADGVLADAQTRASIILQEAQMKAQQMVDENEITRRAEAFAQNTRAKAQEEADSIYTQAVNMAKELLSGAAATMTKNAQDLAALRDKILQDAQNPNR